MKKLSAIAILLLILTACSGPLWEGVPRSAGDSGDIHIILFQDDPLWQYIVERNTRHQQGDHSLCGDHSWLE